MPSLKYCQMKSQETPVKILHELIDILHDRIDEYQKALQKLTTGNHLDLKAIFGEMIRESVEYEQELQDNLARMDGSERDIEQEHAGAVYQVWARAKPSIRGGDSKAILSTCEREIHAVRTAYEKALASGDGMDDLMRQKVSRQMEDIRDREERVREYHEAL